MVREGGREGEKESGREREDEWEIRERKREGGRVFLHFYFFSCI